MFAATLACDMDSGWGWTMGIGWVVFLALMVILAFVLLRNYRPESDRTRRSAYDTLDERLARGEIDEQEYRSRHDALHR